MILFALLAFLQLTAVPGYLILRALQKHSAGLAVLTHSLALSLAANYVAVYALVSLGLYTTPMVRSLVLAEWICLAIVLARQNFTMELAWSPTEPPEGSPARRSLLEPVLMGLALATLFVFLRMFVGDIGNVFNEGDDVVSWDAWAMVWARGSVPRSDLYPTLLPANWSLAYLLLGTAEVKLVGKAMMPLFSVATMLVFIDQHRRTRELSWLAAVIVYAAILFHVFTANQLTAGYADIPVGFFAILTATSYLEGRRTKWADPRALQFAVIFASAAAVVKQGGLFVLICAVAWCLAIMLPRRTLAPAGGRAAILVLVGIALALDWWWISKLWHVLAGQDHGAPVTVSAVSGNTSGYLERLRSGMAILVTQRAGSYLPYAIGGLLALSLTNVLWRSIMIAFVAPFFVIYALFFSYEARSFSAAFPFVAACAGGGIEQLGVFGRRMSGRLRKVLGLRNEISPTAAAIIVTASGVVIAILVAKMLPADRWAKDVGVRWPLVLTGGGVFAGALAANLVPAFTVRVNILKVVLGAATILGLFHITSLSPETILAQQLERQRTTIGTPEINKRLYEYAARRPFDGLIATNYWYLGSLPELKQHCRLTSFPGRIDPALLQQFAANFDIDYLLVKEAALGGETRKWMAGHGMDIEFVQGDFALVRVTEAVRPMRSGILTAEPNPVPICDGTGMGTVKLVWKSTGTSTITVRFGSPDGVGVPTIGEPAGEITTGKWVPDGTVFYLQDLSGGRALDARYTLATVQVHATTNGCSGVK